MVRNDGCRQNRNCEDQAKAKCKGHGQEEGAMKKTTIAPLDVIESSGGLAALLGSSFVDTDIAAI